MEVIDTIKKPADIKKMSIGQLNQLADEVRSFLINSVSKTGGHIGANLGTVELTIALHFVFDSPKDPIIFDTGHQGYTHKILTGRKKLFKTLNQYKGMSRFLTRSESIYDIIDATHAGTALSTAAGMAYSFMEKRPKNKQSFSVNKVVVIVGDGSMVEGVNFEGLNFIAGTNLPIVIVLNDNEMAIAPNVGGIKNLTQGKGWKERSKKFFGGLGFDYLAVDDGHNLTNLINALKRAKRSRKPIVVHAKTEKGKGLAIAKNHPYKMHFSMPFDPKTGQGASATIVGKTYAVIAAEELEKILKKDRKIVVITPATPYASSLDRLIKFFPERVIDVGMAEQHAVSMACGLALSGMKPVVCFQTTFMQRAFDQLLHDLAYMNLPVTILGVRSGFAGYDGPTHHGLYDLPYLKSIPNMQISYPSDSSQFRTLIRKRLANPVGPMIILHPYEPISDLEIKNSHGGAVVRLASARDGLILCLGNTLISTLGICETLNRDFQLKFGVACITSIKPLPVVKLSKLMRSVKRIVTLEEGTLMGGLGSSVANLIADNDIDVSLLRIGVNDQFISAGNKIECSKEAGIDEASVVKKIVARWFDRKMA